MQWLCIREQRSDDLKDFHSPLLVGDFHLERPNLAQVDAGTQGLTYRDWYNIIKVYNHTNLTKPSDKLPALSGLASIFSSRLKDEYLAGLWRNDLWSGLTWYFKPWDEAVKQRIYRAPSWSWAAFDGRINFQVELYGNRTFRRDLEILSSEVTRKGLDPFGEITFGKLELRSTLRIIPAECIPPDSIGQFSTSICIPNLTTEVENHPTSDVTIYLDPGHADKFKNTLYRHSRSVGFLLICSEDVEAPEKSSSANRSANEMKAMNILREMDGDTWIALIIQERPSSLGFPQSYIRVGIATAYRQCRQAFFGNSKRERVILF